MPSYKKEAEELRKQKLELERKVQKFEDAEKEKQKGFSCMVYCSHCQIAYNALVPRGGSIHTSGCAWCGSTNSGYLITTNKLCR